MRSTLQELLRAFRPLKDGAPADYIPQLAKVDPDGFAISVTTVAGETVSVGDDDRPFTLQSVSKAFSVGLVLEDHGRERFLEKVGVEPTGEPFHSVIRLEDVSKRPYNPMVNAGAIAVASLVKGKDPKEKLDRLLRAFGKYAGRRLAVDRSVYLSEKATGDRNRAIAHLMRHFFMIDRDIESVLDLYFRQCAVSVTCRDLSCMAATLANGGTNPATGARAVSRDYVRDILTLMFTCGLYDYAGEWAYEVGMPAKSGVSGAVMAVVPGRLGIAVYSPRVDGNGNSPRGIAVCRELSRRWGLHVFDGRGAR